MPTSQGLLDRALDAAKRRAAFPEWAQRRLHFVDGRTGLQCVELPAILNYAQMAGFTSAPNPSYSATRVNLSHEGAEQLLRRLAVSKSDAQGWGAILRDEACKAERELQPYVHGGIEDY
jgi:hypothetical protein